MATEWMKDIDRTWTLFLDRDGVINIEKEGDYIRHLSEFRFIDGIMPAFQVFSAVFQRVFVVTNQKGVGKGLMSVDDLGKIHGHLAREVEEAGGRLDRIYYCTALDNDHPCRKPNPGMALQAQLEFPEIEFSRSLMIGNTMSDMKFGKSLGMRTIFIPSAKPPVNLPDPLVDAIFPDLLAVAKALQNGDDGQ